MSHKRSAIYCAVVVGFAVAAVAGCKHETGPSLSAVIENETLTPTTTEPNAAQNCCCRVTGNVRNTSPIEAHMSLRWKVTDVDGKDVGTAVDFVPNVKPGAMRPFDAAGIYTSCARVKAKERSVLVIGLYHDDSAGQ